MILLIKESGVLGVNCDTSRWCKFMSIRFLNWAGWNKLGFELREDSGIKTARNIPHILKLH